MNTQNAPVEETPINQPLTVPPVVDDVPVMCVLDIDNNVYGPYSRNEVCNLITEERIANETLVCFRVAPNSFWRLSSPKPQYTHWKPFGRSQWAGMLSRRVKTPWATVVENNNTTNNICIDNHSQVRQITDSNSQLPVKYGDVTDEFNKILARLESLTFVTPRPRIEKDTKFNFQDAVGMIHGPFFGEAIPSLMNKGLINVNSPVRVLKYSADWKILNDFTWPTQSYQNSPVNV